jgi:hypothetical protein
LREAAAESAAASATRALERWSGGKGGGRRMARGISCIEPNIRIVRSPDAQRRADLQTSGPARTMPAI